MALWKNITVKGRQTGKIPVAEQQLMATYYAVSGILWVDANNAVCDATAEPQGGDVLTVTEVESSR